MRDIDRDTITAAVMAACGPETTPRVRALLEGAVTHLHDYIRAVQPTHEEWRTVIRFLTRAGAITSEERNEFVLASDVLGVSSLIDMVNSAPGATESSVLGPFHVRGAPELPVGGDLIGANPGEPVVVSGHVRDTQGNAIPHAVLEIWQTAANGLYSNQDENQSAYNLRARMRTGADGRYAFTTIRPEPYSVPDDGPVGDLLRVTGRRAWRPSHLHVIVEAEGYRSVVTELFPADDPYLDRDAVFGVRASLVIPFTPQTDASTLPDDIVARAWLKGPFSRVDFDFVLGRAAAG